MDPRLRFLNVGLALVATTTLGLAIASPLFTSQETLKPRPAGEWTRLDVDPRPPASVPSEEPGPNPIRLEEPPEISLPHLGRAPTVADEGKRDGDNGERKDKHGGEGREGRDKEHGDDDEDDDGDGERKQAEDGRHDGDKDDEESEGDLDEDPHEGDDEDSESDDDEESEQDDN